MGLNLKILKMSIELFAWRYTERVADQADHFANAFAHENIVYGYNVATRLWRSKVYSWLHFV